MFQVRPLASANRANVSSGIRFGALDEPLLFELTSDVVTEPVIFEFVVQKDPDKKPFDVEFDASRLNAERRVRLTFSNPDVGTSGLKAPAQTLGIGGTSERFALEIMFLIDFSGSGFYRLTYEFTESKTELASQHAESSTGASSASTPA